MTSRGARKLTILGAIVWLVAVLTWLLHPAMLTAFAVIVGAAWWVLAGAYRDRLEVREHDTRLRNKFRVWSNPRHS